MSQDQASVTYFGREVTDVLTRIRELLISKNVAYGDSALSPVRVFSRLDAVEGLRVRIDDKLSRLARGQEMGEDVLDDLIGYLVMLKIAQRRASEASQR